MFFRAAFILLITWSCAGAVVTYELLREFPRPGTQPLAPLVPAGDGNLYGTAVAGGAVGFGSVFRVTPAGALTTLISFTGTGGSALGNGPDAGLAIGADGALYGVTASGGAGNFGTAFKVTTAGVFTPLVSFAGGPGGSVPQALARHPDGNFYGVTVAGGAGGFGTVFRLTSAGALTTLMEFTGTTGLKKGASPVGSLTFNGTTLYGVTKSGGAGNFGTVFSLTTAGTFTLMAEFTGTAGTLPGSGPAGGLLFNTDGALYGTTEFGGANNFGTAFMITTAAAFTSIRTFADAKGSQPAGALVRGSDAQLYGTTAAGGIAGLGTLYKMTTAGVPTVLTNFTGETGAAPGAVPRGGVMLGTDGFFYAATSAGGPGNLGVIWKGTAAGAFTALTNLSLSLGWAPSGPPVVENAGALLFPMSLGGDNGGGSLVRLTTASGVSVVAALGGTLGSGPAGGLVQSGADFFGVAASGGASNRGTAFKFTSPTGAALVASYTSTSGGAPEGALITGSDGAFYGVSREGGTTARGTLYKVTTTGVRTRIVSFTGTAGAVKGTRPRGPLVLAANTKFYGVTEAGGAADAGTLFTMTAAGVLTTLAEFTVAGPRAPLGGLTIGADGLLYGTLSAGGAGNAGALLRIDPATDTWSTPVNFTSPATGGGPAGALTAGADGAIYGLTTTGGPGGAGSVWRYTTAVGLESLVSFSGGGGPGGLAFGGDGKLYGVTAGGGAGGGGTAFRLTLSTPYSTWKQTELGDANAADLGDPDHDGFPTLLEYALMMHPAVPDAPNAVEGSFAIVSGRTFLAATVPRDPAHPDITVTVETASMLAGPWSAVAASVNGAPFAGAGYLSGDSVAPGLKSLLVRDVVSTAEAPHRFLRLRASR